MSAAAGPDSHATAGESASGRLRVGTPGQARAHVLVGAAENRLMRKTVLALLAVMVCGVVGTASAQPVRGLAWALVSTTAPSAFQFNSARPAGGSITVAYFGAGQYVVTIPDLGSAAGTAHAVAANGNHHCNVASWGPSGADLLIAVTCYSSTGTTTAGDFNVFYYKESRSETAWSSGYLWAQTASSTPSPPGSVTTAR